MATLTLFVLLSNPGHAQWQERRDWAYQHFAREIGEAQEREYLERIDYGNADPSGGIDDAPRRKQIAREMLQSIGAMES